MPVSTSVLVPLAVLQGETLSEAAAELLSSVDIVLVGYHDVPDQTATEQARDAYEDRLRRRLDEHASLFDEGGAFESEQTAEAGHTFEHTFDDAEEGDVFEYVCEPHVGVGMLGAVAIGDIDDEIVGGEDAEVSEDGAPARQLTMQDLGALALGLGFAGALLVPLFYAAHRKASQNE